MTRLSKWLSAIVLFVLAWLSVVLDIADLHLSQKIMSVVITIPLYILMSFACYSLATIGYGVTTFNDCELESQNLYQEIQEAKRDLITKGFTFTSPSH